MSGKSVHLDKSTIQLKNFQEFVIIYSEGNTCHGIGSSLFIVELSCPFQRNYENNQRAGEIMDVADFDRKLWNNIFILAI